MKNKILKLLKTENKEDQLIALNLLHKLTNQEIEEIIPVNDHIDHQIKNNSYLKGVIKLDEYILLIGIATISLYNIKELFHWTVDNQYKLLNKKLELCRKSLFIQQNQEK